ncbi:MAG: cyclodeaminase/cyclohydrolase family protein [Peptostreptococcaceae bacterium]|jgi:formiminotetrahydrofolate cyclodeaminase|nr:cyclodeaminase/cyclohydrolase family protein [Peptostreptococcaceae bacterium]
MNYQNDTILEFSEKLSSKASVPGGGSLTAIISGLSTSLMLMVCNISKSNKNLEKYKDELQEIIKKLENINNIFFNFSNEDAINLQKLMDSYKLKKESKDDIDHRKKEIEKNLKQAISVPLNTLKLTIDALEILKNILDKSSKMLISDIGVSAFCFESVLNNAYLNILINTKYLKDLAEKEEINSKAKILLNKGLESVDLITKEVLKEVE